MIASILREVFRNFQAAFRNHNRIKRLALKQAAQQPAAVLGDVGQIHCQDVRPGGAVP